MIRSDSWMGVSIPLRLFDIFLVDEQIDVPAQPALVIHYVWLDGGVLFRQIINSLRNSTPRNLDFRMIIYVIFHQGRQCKCWHFF